MAGFVDDLKAALSPAEQSIVSGFSQGPIGGLMHAASKLPDLAGETVSMLNPANAVSSLQAGVTGQQNGFRLTPAERGLALAGVLGIGGVAAGRRFYALRGEPGFMSGDRGEFAPGTFFGKTDYRYGTRNPEVGQLGVASNLDEVASVLNQTHPRDDAWANHDAVRKADILALGQRRLQESETDANYASSFQDPMQQQALAAARAHARMIGLQSQGVFNMPGSTAMSDLYDRWRRHPAALSQDQRQALQDWLTDLSHVTDQWTDEEGNLPASAKWVGINATADGPETYISPTFLPTQRSILDGEPDDLTKIRLGMRLEQLNHRAAMPEMVQNILSYFNAADPKIADDVVRGVNWYDIAHGEATDMASLANVARRVASGIVAAFSPQTDWDINRAGARAFLEGDQYTKPSGIVGSAKGTMGPIEKAREILATQSDQEVLNILRANKTSNFFVNIDKPEQSGSVTIDRHAHDVAMGFALPGMDTDYVFDPNGRAYNAMATAHRIAAVLMSLGLADTEPGVSELLGRKGFIRPHEVQAGSWEAIRNQKQAAGWRKGFARAGTPIVASDNILSILEGRALPLGGLGERGSVFGVYGSRNPVPAGQIVLADGPRGRTLLGDQNGTNKSVLRSSVPTEPEQGWTTWLPVQPRSVSDVLDYMPAHFLAGGPDGSTPPDLRFFESDHPQAVGSVTTPGNHLVVHVSAQDRRFLNALRSALKVFPDVAPTKKYQGVEHHFSVKGEPQGPEDFKTPADFERFLNYGQYVGVSAHKDGMTPKQTANATAKLEAELQKRGYKYLRTDGHYGGAPEPSFLVPGMPNSEGRELGRMFGQDSVLTPGGYLYSKGDHWNPVLGDPKMEADPEGNYSETQIGNGKKVTWHLPIDFNNKMPLHGHPDLDLVTHEMNEIHGLWAPLGDTIRPDTLDQIAKLVQDLAEKHNVEISPRLYLHGSSHAPQGWQEAGDHPFMDTGQRQVVAQHQTYDPGARNAVPVWVPNKDWAQRAPMGDNLLEQAPKLSWEAQTGASGSPVLGSRLGDAVVNHELRVFVSHLRTQGKGFVPDGSNVLASKFAGRRPAHFALYLPEDPSDLPAISLGHRSTADAKQGLAALQPDEHRLVMGSVSRGKVTLEVPASPLSDSFPDIELSAYARSVLARAGVPAGDIAKVVKAA